MSRVTARGGGVLDASRDAPRDQPLHPGQARTPRQRGILFPLPGLQSRRPGVARGGLSVGSPLTPGRLRRDPHAETPRHLRLTSPELPLPRVPTAPPALTAGPPPHPEPAAAPRAATPARSPDAPRAPGAPGFVPPPPRPASARPRPPLSTRTGRPLTTSGGWRRIPDGAARGQEYGIRTGHAREEAASSRRGGGGSTTRRSLHAGLHNSPERGPATPAGPLRGAATLPRPNVRAGALPVFRLAAQWRTIPSIRREQPIGCTGPPHVTAPGRRWKVGPRGCWELGAAERGGGGRPGGGLAGGKRLGQPQHPHECTTSGADYGFGRRLCPAGRASASPGRSGCPGLGNTEAEGQKGQAMAHRRQSPDSVIIWLQLSTQCRALHKYHLERETFKERKKIDELKNVNKSY
nr:PREDICTED: dapper homolog 3-like [Equus przewalskii]